MALSFMRKQSQRLHDMWKMLFLVVPKCWSVVNVSMAPALSSRLLSFLRFPLEHFSMSKKLSGLLQL
jgi:hypothetical protein